MQSIHFSSPKGNILHNTIWKEMVIGMKDTGRRYDACRESYHLQINSSSLMPVWFPDHHPQFTWYTKLQNLRNNFIR